MRIDLPSSPLAGEPDVPARSQAGLALATLALSTLLGGAILAVVLWTVSTLSLDPRPEWVVRSPAAEAAGAAGGATIGLASPPGLVLLGGTTLAVLAAGAAAAALLSPIASLYRRGALAVVSAFATIVLAVLALPLHHHFGRAGLLALGGACAAGVLLLGRPVARLRRELR